MDSEYVIMSSMELGMLTPLEAIVVDTHPGVYNRVREIVDGNIDASGDWIANISRLAFRKSPERYRHLVSLMSVVEHTQAVNAMVERLESLVMRKAGMDLGWYTERPLWINSNLLGGDQRQIPVMFTDVKDISEPMVVRYLDSLNVAADLKLRLQQDVAEIKYALGVVPKEEVPLLVQGDDYSHLPKRRRIPRQVRANQLSKDMRQRALKAIKKVSALFESFGKKECLQMFISGQTVEISHPNSKLKFEVRAFGDQDWLLRRSVREFTAHAPFELSLLTKDDVFLANLCVYFSETPVLDQLLGLISFVESGSEEDLLEKANFFGRVALEQEVLATLPSVVQKKMEIRKVESAAGLVDDLWALPEPAPGTSLWVTQRWREFSNPVKQWARSWLGDALLELREVELPDTVRNVNFQQMHRNARRLLAA